MNIFGVMPTALMFIQVPAPTGWIYNVGKVLYTILMFALILIITYYATQFIAKKSVVKNKNKNLRILEALSLGIDKSIYLVKIGEQHVLLASTHKNITLLSQVDADLLYREDLTEIDSSTTNNFDSYLNGFNQKIKKDFLMKQMRQKLERLDTAIRGNKADE